MVSVHPQCHCVPRFLAQDPRPRPQPIALVLVIQQVTRIPSRPARVVKSSLSPTKVGCQAKGADNEDRDLARIVKRLLEDWILGKVFVGLTQPRRPAAMVRIRQPSLAFAYFQADAVTPSIPVHSIHRWLSIQAIYFPRWCPRRQCWGVFTYAEEIQRIRAAQAPLPRRPSTRQLLTYGIAIVAGVRCNTGRHGRGAVKLPAPQPNVQENEPASIRDG